MGPTFQHTFANGLRLIHIESNGPVAHCGVLINAGSRDEKPGEEGLAHFIEHVIFKGTKKRKSYHILSRLEDVGGELNAYTGKEETCIYASFLREDYARSIELFGDIIFNSIFPDKEVAKEKDVVIDEILSYKDSPSELIFDDFQELIYANHPMGANILGSKKNVKGFTRAQIQNFIQEHYIPENMVISSIGNISGKKLSALIEKHFGEAQSSINIYQRTPLTPYHVITKEVAAKTYQTHCVIGNRAYAANDKKRSSLVLLNNLLGGPGMNTRLNLNIREKYGFTYTIESFYTSYSDTGEFGIYFGTDKDTVKKCMELTLKELEKLRTAELGPTQLGKAKKQLMGQIAIGQESNSNYMLSMGKSMLFFNKIDSLEQIQTKIDKIDAKALRDIANEIFAPETLSTLIYKAK